MNLRHLQFFRELAKTQHMSKAAENLGISQPSLSYAIKKLEAEVGVPLFEPDGRNIKLTQIGKIYLSYIDNSLDSLSQGNAIVRQLTNPDQGHVNLGFTYTMGQRLVPELMTHFKAQKENQKISFDLGQNTTPQLLQDLYNDKYDVVLASYSEFFNEQEADNVFQFIPIVKQAIRVAIPVDHPLATKDKIYFKDLEKYPIILFSKNSGLRPLIDKIIASSGIKPNVLYEIEEDYTIAGFVANGVGIAIMPNLPLLNQDRVLLRPIEDNTTSHDLYLITKQNHFVTPSVHRFHNFVRSYCRQTFASAKQLI
ncbi:LysR family transcriptional regulator [Secundilactobacillus paracollinoides]|uniref:LysR family transcriptional regulator n=1 Tax=Secundilactobacillus paracollinoides TaxID=240427 RepID=A0A1B2IW49_9LACO|nr:LysR family transcriptional regulator [Secundilactobacillus paracollinoides]ANZ60435.1 LysR family transcriptional regulator [Secundilactobacillus paracollinoides]ANZ66263.1 LysR family transcriptional regulator [Secundilactobacillus paracollinoides]